MLVSACKCWMGRKRPRLWDCSWISNKGVHHNWTVCEGKVFSKHVCIYIKHSISKLSSITRRKFICYFADFLILQLMMMRTCAIFFRLCDWRLGARRAREISRGQFQARAWGQFTWHVNLREESTLRDPYQTIEGRIMFGVNKSLTESPSRRHLIVIPKNFHCEITIFGESSNT